MNVRGILIQENNISFPHYFHLDLFQFIEQYYMRSTRLYILNGKWKAYADAVESFRMRKERERKWREVVRGYKKKNHKIV